MIKIKVNPKYITKIICIIIFLICIIGLCLYAYLNINENNIQNILNQNFYIILFLLIFSIILILIENTSYISEMIISSNYIEIIYKQGLKEEKRIVIEKADIESFEAISSIDKYRIRKGSIIKSNTLVEIKLKDKKCIKFFVDSKNRLYGCPYQFILDLIKFSREIPNFKYEILGNYYFAKKDIENYIQYGRGLNIKEQLLYEYNSQPPYVIFFFIFFILSMLIIIGVMVYISIPY